MPNKRKDASTNTEPPSTGSAYPATTDPEDFMPASYTTGYSQNTVKKWQYFVTQPKTISNFFETISSVEIQRHSAGFWGNKQMQPNKATSFVNQNIVIPPKSVFLFFILKLN